MNALRTRAIVLKRTNYGEADRILQILTPEGKRSVMAKGVRREKSKLASGIELFAICDVVVSEGRGDLCVLTSARLVYFYRHILENYDRLQFAYAVIKLVSTSSEMVDSPDWYDVLAETLAGIDARSINLDMTMTWFYLHYSALLGYELSLWRDVNGDELSSELAYKYDVSEKGLRATVGGEITANHIKLMRLIATKPLKVLAQIGGVNQILGDCSMLARQHAAI